MNLRYICVLILLAAIAAPVAAKITVLPLGDSITRGDYEGDSANGSWRYYLAGQLDAGGFDVDFVGSTTFPTYTRFAFDQDHDGHGGYTTGMLLSYGETEPLKAWMAAYGPPDVVLLMIGTNDALLQVPLADRLRNLRGIVAELRGRSPNVRILLAKIIPTADSARNAQQIAPFNAALPALASELSTPASPIIVVDQYSGYDGAADNGADGIHPDRGGMQKIAARWYAALTPLLSAPGPTTTVPPIILPTPTPLVVPGGTGSAGDPNDDGLCEDVNGNGRKDFADVVLFFSRLDWCAGHAPWAFDFNGNGRIDFADVTRLFNLIG
ncbi:MAG: GDSL-type esterase/lipase family protein [Methanospirillum sp.]